MAGLRMSADGTRLLHAVRSKPDSWKKWEQRRPLVLRREAADAEEAAYFTLNGRFLGTFHLWAHMDAPSGGVSQYRCIAPNADSPGITSNLSEHH